MTKYKCLYDITGRIEDVATFLVPLKDLPKQIIEHWSDCAMNSEPAYPAGECDCGGFKQYQDEGMCQACEFGQCTTKAGCVAISNPPPKQEQGESLIWSTTQGGAFVCGEYHVVQRVDDKGWNAHKGYEHLLLAASFAACKTACERDAAESLSTQDQGEPVANMTAHRAMYFIDRFKREEKLLGPNEQAAVDFVTAILNNPPPQQRKPLTDEQIATILRELPKDIFGYTHSNQFARAIEAAHDIKE